MDSLEHLSTAYFFFNLNNHFNLRIPMYQILSLNNSAISPSLTI